MSHPLDREHYTNYEQLVMTYLLAELGQDGWAVKIGATSSSHNLTRRVRNLQAGNPRRLVLAAVVVRPGSEDETRRAFPNSVVATDHRAGYELEQHLLTVLHERRVPDSEWVLDVDPYAIVRIAEDGVLP